MSNTNAPNGFTPVQYINGAPFDGKTRLYWIPQTDTNAYGVGDPVASITNADSNGVPGVTLGTPGLPVRGVITAVQPNPKTLESPGVPATKQADYYVYVADDPKIVFAVQESGVPLTASNVDQKANFLINAPSLTTSTAVIDNSTIGTGVNILLLGLRLSPDNGFGQYAKWLVVFTLHELAGVSTNNGSPLLDIVDDGSATHLVTAADAGVNVITLMTNGSANTVHIQKDATLNLPVGFTANYMMAGSGQTTLAVDSGVTLTSVSSFVTFAGTGAVVTIFKASANNWYAFGALIT